MEKSLQNSTSQKVLNSSKLEKNPHILHSIPGFFFYTSNNFYFSFVKELIASMRMWGIWAFYVHILLIVSMHLTEPKWRCVNSQMAVESL